MDLPSIFHRYRRLLAFAHLLGGESLRDRIRNLAWISDLLASSDEVWQLDELAILGQESTPFTPVTEIAAGVSGLRLLKYDPPTKTYRVPPHVDLYEQGLPASIGEQDCQYAVAELRELLEGGPAQRTLWTQSDLTTILRGMTEFGLHCIRSWRSLVENGKDLAGVPFLWNVGQAGETTPHGELPASSATIDIVRLTVEPLNFLGISPAPDAKSLIRWAFDRIYRNISFGADTCASYLLPADDSYPNTAHPINDSQSRVITLLVSLLKEEQDYLDSERRQQALEAALALTRYLLSQQLRAEGEGYDGFWSFHRYGSVALDGYQVLSINSELAVTALTSVFGFADQQLRIAITQSVSWIVTALQRTAVRNGAEIGWRRNFAGSRSPSGVSDNVKAEVPNDRPLDVTEACEIFATARAMLMFASAKALGACDGAADYVRGALAYMERHWVVKLRSAKDDVEFIAYRSPESAQWSDVTYRITNPISAVLPYYVLRAARLSKERLPLVLTEPVNNCMNFALENYGGHGFWRDAGTGLAYPTNTAFNMGMLMEYVRASEFETTREA